jgi:hypothetical protein
MYAYMKTKDTTLKPDKIRRYEAISLETIIKNINVSHYDIII